MFLDHRDDVCRCKASQRGFCEVRIFGEEVFCAAVDIGEVASTATGDEDLFANAFGVIEQHDAPSAAACFNCTHHAGSARSQDYDISLLHVRSPLLVFF
jgi:hypothetical protein